MKDLVAQYLQALDIDVEITTLEDITKLIKAHLRTFPFGSLKVLLKENISLDVESIYEGIVLKRRGGYCFEHNKLIYEVLKTLGFDVTYYLARVVNNTDTMPPQTHRFTLLDYNGDRYLIDVGIGFRSPSVPVKFGQESSISHLGKAYTIKEFDDKTYGMQLIEKENPFIATKFDLNTCYESDFEMGHFYSHKHPNAVFVNNLVLSRAQDTLIHSLVNDNYFKIYKDTTEKVVIKDANHLARLLKDDFRVHYTLDEIAFFYDRYVKN